MSGIGGLNVPDSDLLFKTQRLCNDNTASVSNCKATVLLGFDLCSKCKRISYMDCVSNNRVVNEASMINSLSSSLKWVVGASYKWSRSMYFDNTVSPNDFKKSEAYSG